MSRVIYKYPLEMHVHGDFVFQAPKTAKIVTFGFQNNQPMLWAEVDPEDSTKSIFRLKIVATGEVFDQDNYTHLSTAFNGPFVWHLYENRG